MSTKSLSKARYIIGVDCLVGDKMLFSAAYRGCLRSDVKIIAGKRVASIPSASKLLAGVAEFYYKSLLEEKKALVVNRPEQLETLLNKICKTVKMLRSAVNHVVTGQVDITGNLNSSNELTVNADGRKALESVNEQLQVLSYIKQKIQKLS